jgi:hypothetical protein
MAEQFEDQTPPPEKPCVMAQLVQVGSDEALGQPHLPPPAQQTLHQPQPADWHSDALELCTELVIVCFEALLGQDWPIAFWHPSPPRPPFEAMAIRRKAGRGEQMHCFYAMRPHGRGCSFFQGGGCGRPGHPVEQFIVRRKRYIMAHT